jgi:hypothetical protein
MSSRSRGVLELDLEVPLLVNWMASNLLEKTTKPSFSRLIFIKSSSFQAYWSINQQTRKTRQIQKTTSRPSSCAFGAKTTMMRCNRSLQQSLTYQINGPPGISLLVLRRSPGKRNHLFGDRGFQFQSNRGWTNLLRKVRRGLQGFGRHDVSIHFLF